MRSGVFNVIWPSAKSLLPVAPSVHPIRRNLAMADRAEATGKDERARDAVWPSRAHASAGRPRAPLPHGQDVGRR